MSDIVIPAKHVPVIYAALSVMRDELDRPSAHFSTEIQRRHQAEIDAALAAIEQVHAALTVAAAAIGLLPCLHCQSKAYPYDYDTEIDMWPVRCNNSKCNAQVCSPISQEDAISRWNRRPAPITQATGRGEVTDAS